jgi:hypothetical protein
VTGVHAYAPVGQSKALGVFVEPIATNQYGQTPDTLCLPDGLSRQRRVLAWHSRSGTTTITFPSDSIRETNYRERAMLAIHTSGVGLFGLTQCGAPS